MTGEAPSVRPISVGSHRPHSMGGTIDTALRLERALDVVSDVFVLFDSDFRVVYHNEANRAAMRATGMDPDAAIGKDVLDAMPQLAGTVGHRESQRSMSERVSTEWEETYHPDLRLRGRAYPTADGGLMVVASNITAEWKALEAARGARVTAEDANRAKSDFLAAMSHELRTPLNAIGGYTELLTLGLRGPLTDEQKQDLRRISRNQEHLSTLINEVLSFARIEANHVEVVLGHVAVSEVLAGVEPIMAPQIAQKNLCFAIEDHSPALEMLADRDKVQRARRGPAFGEHRGARHGHRNSRAPHRRYLRAVRAGAPLAARANVGHRAGVGDQPRPGAPHGRGHRGRERGRSGLHVYPRGAPGTLSAVGAQPLGDGGLLTAFAVGCSAQLVEIGEDDRVTGRICGLGHGNENPQIVTALEFIELGPVVR
jgi:nitrogen-specific signal transduction histidine kinase